MIFVILSVPLSQGFILKESWLLKLSVRENWGLWNKTRVGWTCELCVQSSKWCHQSFGVKLFKQILWFLFYLLLLLSLSSFLVHPLFLRQLQLLLDRCEPASSLLLSSCPSRSCILFQLKAHRHGLSYLNSTLVYSREPFGTSSWQHLPCIRAEAKVLENIISEEFRWTFHGSFIWGI